MTTCYTFILTVLYFIYKINSKQINCFLTGYSFSLSFEANNEKSYANSFGFNSYSVMWLLQSSDSETLTVVA